MPTSAQHRERPGVGDARVTRQPLKIDRLPASVKMAIQRLYGTEGMTWQEIEDLSRLPKDEDGFVEWDKLDTEVLALFPGRFLPHSNLHRWYDLRIRQVKQNVMERSVQARELAEAFSKSVVEGGSSAVLNAARDTFMTVLAEDSSTKGRSKAARELVLLAQVMQAERANDIKERQVAVSERKLKALEEEAERKRALMDEETARMSKKASKGEVRPEDIDRLRERVFGLPPKAKAS